MTDMRLHRFVLLAAAALAASAAAKEPYRLRSEQATIAWSQIFASDHDDWINDIIALKDGYLAVGFLNRTDGDGGSDWRALAAKVAGDGKVLWTKEYGAGGGIDAFWSARETADGLMFGGFSSRVGPGGINAYFAATDSRGLLRKENAYGTPGYDRITGLAETPTGFIGAGHAEGRDGRDVLLIGVDSEGVETWRRVFAEAGSNGALYIEPAGDGNYIVSGGTAPAGDADMLVLKVDASGNEIWRRVIGEPRTDDVNHGLVVLADGRIVAAGYTNSWGEGERDFMAAVLSPSGDLLSLSTIGGRGDDRLISAEADAEGRIFFWTIGHTASAGAGGSDVLVGRLEADGGFADGVILIGGEKDDNGTAILPLGDDLLVGGYSTGLGQGAQDAFIARLRGLDLRPHAAFKAARQR